ncbi:MAG: hypothetical protein EPN14_09685 [Gallionella sp.]|nr:MAG: hypothetical protein EPN14_09685 [Gallionella sp.]
MHPILLGFAAILLEASAVAALFLAENGLALLLWFLLLHGLASLALALSAWHYLPAYYRATRRLTLWLLFNFSFFVPVLGPVGLIVAALVSVYWPHLIAYRPFGNVSLPEFDLSLHHASPQFGQGGIKSRLANTVIPTDRRLQALLSLGDVPAHIASPMLHDMLDDSTDDVRLVAYGILDAKEKQINAKIHDELKTLAGTGDDALRLVSLRHLAELYWEHVYSGLAKGDLRLHALETATGYLARALELAPRNPGLWFLKGRLLREQQQPDAALAALDRAVACGLPEERALPYLAELAFERRDYAAVRAMLDKIASTQITQKMQTVIRFWASGAPEKTL